MDFATSSHPGVQAQLDRLAALSVPDGRLGLETVRQLLARLGDPHKRVPPTFHVAGTNGKGSTCAFLRAMLEAEGYRVHVTTSPHLVRYNERIRLAGKLIEDDHLAALLGEVLEQIDGLNPSFFEVTIAAAFLAFSREPADACVVEVGLGGRFDATNVLGPEVLAACGIAALGIDHERFLLAPEEGVPTEPMARIAFEKAGIAKKGVPLVTIAQRPLEMAAIRAVADRVGAPVTLACEAPDVPIALPGQHQRVNAGLAAAMLRAQQLVPIADAAIERGMADARWPARLQRLSSGPLTGRREVWLDGGHNPSAGDALAKHFAGQRFHLIAGMIEGKNPAALTKPLADMFVSLSVVPVPAHDCYPAEAFGTGARANPDVATAIAALPDDGLTVLIAGSLYLAGEVLRLNDQIPD
ncbi:bifunctional folylpolyglutamate synthase/dihydrofolate synthase [Erythrobacter sp. SDW2]|uniref:bifunctional folylpolyglutamate synthase/dihydrofolate synthase n=1 Tax=Erythrobacter sp. SDW2 TaxID=2907154 RepID=UPI001F1EC9CA|nr:folylpolyglutamate synthase/dihydrofolate synthase family protein [Erythrobacter sp. SDW2]UIP05504.1 bifunctional folylpolyglutamate synthase/dihydrofolate synthase [Erythrobacter sp. SDW2]